MRGLGRFAAAMWVAVAACVAVQGAAAAESAPPAQGTRTIYIVRHGQYDQDAPSDPDLGPGLTDIGREQAKADGAWFASLPVKADVLYASPLTRARESAEIIGAAIGLRPVVLDDLQECTPPTIREDIMAHTPASEADSCRQTLDRDFERFFRPTSGRDSTVLLVCHGNVSRYLVARAVGLETKLWLNMSIAHASIATVKVRPKYGPQLVSVGDVGQLPPRLVTFTNPTRRDSSGTRRK